MWLPAGRIAGESAEVVVHGHYGRPILWFASEAGSPHDFADNGLLDTLRESIDAGRVKIFCLPSYDEHSWSASCKPLQDRARAHLAYEDFVLWEVVPFLIDDCSGRRDIVTAGTSMGAFHAVLFALRHAHLFSHALALSGNYDPRSWRGWGEHSDEEYRTNPIQFVPGLAGRHLDFLRAATRISLVVGSGRWEDSTGAHSSTHRMAELLRDKLIPHDLFVWGQQWPHDWPSWRAQAATYVPDLR